MGHRRLTASARDKRILIEHLRAETDGRGHPTKNLEWLEAANPWANIEYGSGSEQREAAQNSGSQTASFAVLCSSETRAVGIQYRIRYPISDLDPTKWPIWEISAIAELGFNEGFAFTATRIAA